MMLESLRSKWALYSCLDFEYSTYLETPRLINSNERIIAQKEACNFTEFNRAVSARIITSLAVISVSTVFITNYLLFRRYTRINTYEWIFLYFSPLSTFYAITHWAGRYCSKYVHCYLSVIKKFSRSIIYNITNRKLSKNLLNSFEKCLSHQCE